MLDLCKNLVRISLPLTPYTYRCSYYDVYAVQQAQTCSIRMQTYTPYLTTKPLLHTHDVLVKNLPSILQSTCYNENQLPFDQEVRQTELGHLFEHILLEYLCLTKINTGYTKAIYAGRTSWNWQEETRGVYHINVDTTHEDWRYVIPAFLRTNRLMHIILSNIQNNAHLLPITRNMLPRIS